MWEMAIGGVIAIVAGLLTQVMHHILDNDRQRRSMAGALAGEISAICDIAYRRKYLSEMERLLKKVQDTNEVIRFIVPMTHNYYHVYQASAGGLGVLPPEVAEAVVLFYTQAQAFTEDTMPSSSDPVDAAAAKERLKEGLELLRDTLDLGRELKGRLQGITYGTT